MTSAWRSWTPCRTRRPDRPVRALGRYGVSACPGAWERYLVRGCCSSFRRAALMSSVGLPVAVTMRCVGTSRGVGQARRAAPTERKEPGRPRVGEGAGRGRVPVGDVRRGLPYLLLEGAALGAHGNGERRSLAGEVGHDLVGGLGGERCGLPVAGEVLLAEADGGYGGAVGGDGDGPELRRIGEEGAASRAGHGCPRSRRKASAPHRGAGASAGPAVGVGPLRAGLPLMAIIGRRSTVVAVECRHRKAAR